MRGGAGGLRGLGGGKKYRNLQRGGGIKELGGGGVGEMVILLNITYREAVKKFIFRMCLFFLSSSFHCMGIINPKNRNKL